MSDLAYRLIVDLSTKGSLAPQLGKLESQAKGIDATFKGIGGSLTSGLSGAAGALEKLGDKVVGVAKSVAMIGAGAAGAGLAYGVTHLNNELEKTKISLAAIFNAQGVSSNINDGLGLASSTIKEMRKDAAKLPGEFHDLLTFFKLGATPGFQSGASVKQLEKMSAMGMAAAAATGVQMEQAAREYAMLLQGRAGSHNIFGALIGFQGEEGHKLNAMTGPERLKAIEEALTKFEGAIDVYGGSFEALQSTLKDNARQVLQKATEPLFDRVKAQLGKANDWFATHQKEVDRFTDRVGAQLARGLDFVVDKIHAWTPAIKSFGQHAAEELQRLWEIAKPFLIGFEKLSQKGLGSKGLFTALEAGALAYGGIKAGKMALPMLGSAKELAMLGGAGELAAAGAGFAGLTSAGLVAGAAAAAATVPLLAAVGAFHAVTDASSEFHTEAVRSADAIAKNLTKAYESTEKTWARIQPQATKVLDFMGTVWLGQIEILSIGLEKASFGLGRFIGQVDDFAKKYNLLATKPPPPPEVERAIGFGFKRPDAPAEDRKATKTGAGGGHGGTHIQKVEIVVTSNQDPNRIARLTAERLQEISRFPTSSARTRNWSAARPG